MQRKTELTPHQRWWNLHLCDKQRKGKLTVGCLRRKQLFMWYNWGAAKPWSHALKWKSSNGHMSWLTWGHCFIQFKHTLLNPCYNLLLFSEIFLFQMFLQHHLLSSAYTMGRKLDFVMYKKLNIISCSLLLTAVKFNLQCYQTVNKDDVFQKITNNEMD